MIRVRVKERVRVRVKKRDRDRNRVIEFGFVENFIVLMAASIELNHYREMVQLQQNNQSRVK